jgi:hypothetical protein
MAYNYDQEKAPLIQGARAAAATGYAAGAAVEMPVEPAPAYGAWSDRLRTPALAPIPGHPASEGLGGVTGSRGGFELRARGVALS